MEREPERRKGKFREHRSSTATRRDGPGRGRRVPAEERRAPSSNPVSRMIERKLVSDFAYTYALKYSDGKLYVASTTNLNIA
jgi:hypothetical protein